VKIKRKGGRKGSNKNFTL